MRLNRALRKLRHRRGNVEIHCVHNGNYIGRGTINHAIRMHGHAQRFGGWPGKWVMRQDQIVNHGDTTCYFTTRRPSVQPGQKVPVREQMASWPPGTAWEVERWLGTAHGIAWELAVNSAA